MLFSYCLFCKLLYLQLIKQQLIKYVPYKNGLWFR